MGMVNIGIIGLGAISGAHISNYITNERAKITAVCDIDKAWLEKESKRLNATGYTDYRELLQDENVDAVVVCLPTYLHAQASIDALNAGKHVLCEKPMACSGKDARAMKEAAERNGRKLMVSHNQRFGSDIQLLQHMNAAGKFGEIYFIRLGWRRPLGMMPTPNERRRDGTIYSRNWFNEKDKGGGVLRDLGSHLLDLAMFITGFPELDVVSASCYRKFRPELSTAELSQNIFDSEDLAAAHIKFRNGLSIQLEVSFGSMIEKEVLLTEIYGTKAGASRRTEGGSPLTVKLFQCTDDTVSTEIVTRYKTKTTCPDEAFLDCIVNDMQPYVTPEEGARVIEIIDSIYASGYSNPPIK
jgi:predicted dehydrogenase